MNIFTEIYPVSACSRVASAVLTTSNFEAAASALVTTGRATPAEGILL